MRNGVSVESLAELIYPRSNTNQVQFKTRVNKLAASKKSVRPIEKEDMNWSAFRPVQTQIISEVTKASAADAVATPHTQSQQGLLH